MTGYTVKELIHELEKYPDYAWVYLAENGRKDSWMCTNVDDDDLLIDACITLSNEETGITM